MPRAVSEWVADHDDQAIPTRVKLRVFNAQGGKCGNCNRKLGVCGEGVEYDHVVALINGGGHRERNLQALCPMCHRNKSAEDMREKSATARIVSKRLGIAKPKRPIPGSKGSGYRKKMDGTVVRIDE